MTDFDRNMARLVMVAGKDFSEMTLEDFDEQSRQLEQALVDNGWNESGGIGFYMRRDHPYIFVDVNGVGQVIGINKGIYFDEFVDDYDDLEKYLKSKKYRFTVFKARTLAAIKNGGWKEFDGKRTGYWGLEMYWNRSFPKAAIQLNVLNGQLEIYEVVDNVAQMHDAVAKGYRKMVAVVKRMHR